jgi:hypothetical protein
VFQHEIDHLDGVLFIDHATEVWRAPSPEEAEAAGDLATEAAEAVQYVLGNETESE